MLYRRQRALTFVPLLALALVHAASCSGADTPVSITVVVIEDLVPKPVPLTDFMVVCVDPQGPPRAVRTDDKGMVAVALAPGKYRFCSAKPVTYRGRALMWDREFVVEPGKALDVKLTDGDATASDISQPGRRIGEEGRIYERIKTGVVTVEAGAGHGSGFVVDPRGLILTNQHVTHNANWAGVRLGPGKRMNATILDEDEEADVAVLLVHPCAVQGLAIVPLADPARGPLAEVGERVMAVGSPLHQENLMTTGVISKVTQDVLLSDVNINSGNSGGPLLNMAGEAIGISTFHDPGKGSPGVSGIVAITKALPVLERARAKLATAAQPDETPLPDICPIPIPVAAIKQAATTRLKPPPLIRAPRNFETQVLTPFYIASQQGEYEREIAKEMNRRAKQRAGKGDAEGFRYSPHAFWNRFSGDHDPVVWVSVRPALKEKWSSGLARVLTAAIGGGRGQAQLEFRDDFYDMVLERGGKPIAPVRRYRMRTDRWFDGDYAAAKDAAYGGLYGFDPRAFEPGESLVLKVRKASDLNKWDTVKLDARQQQRIWEEFAPWRAALAGETK